LAIQKPVAALTLADKGVQQTEIASVRISALVYRVLAGVNKALGERKAV